MRGGRSGQLTVILATLAAGAVACSSGGSPSATSTHSSRATATQQLQINVTNPPEQWKTVGTYSYSKRRGWTSTKSANLPWNPDAPFTHTAGLRWSVRGTTLDIQRFHAWRRRYSLATNHVVAIQVRSAQVVRRHSYFWLGVAGTPTNSTGGALLLELDPQGNVASLERVAAPVRDDSKVKRMFYVAADGTVYQWFATPTYAELRIGP